MDSPYAPPRALVVDHAPVSDDEVVQLREAHIRHETRLKAVGSLYYVGGALVVLSGLAMIPAYFDAGADFGPMIGVFTLFYVGAGALSLTLGYGFRRLMPWVRIPGALLSGIGLLAIPIGTIVNAWILYLMFCEKGRTVLASDYAAIIAATPEVRYQRTIGDWIAVIVIGALLLGVIVMIALSGLRG
jgi:hypothetical protein